VVKVLINFLHNMGVKLQVRHTDNGKYKVSYLANDEYIGPTIASGYEWDGWMREDVEAFYKEGTEILDIGANIGYNSLMFSDYGPVYAFEPLFHKVVQLNVENNNLKHKMYVVPIALSDKREDVDMYLPVQTPKGYRNYGGSSIHLTDQLDPETKTTVPCHRLDDVYKGITSFIKIDVEDHEMQVLKGAENTIKKFMPTILIEIHDFENSKVPKYLKSLGYDDPDPRPECMFLYRAKDILSTM
jgi:FkbM family methyltransferase